MLQIGDIVTINQQPNIRLGDTGFVRVPDYIVGVGHQITSIDAIDGDYKYRFRTAQNEIPYWSENELTLTVKTHVQPKMTIGDHVAISNIKHVFVGNRYGCIPAKPFLDGHTHFVVVGLLMGFNGRECLIRPTAEIGQNVFITKEQNLKHTDPTYSLF